MFSNLSSHAPSLASNVVAQITGSDAYRAVTPVAPVILAVSNAGASAVARDHAVHYPPLAIDQSGEIGSQAEDPQALGNRRLRAAFAYGQVVRLLDSQQLADLDRDSVEEIASGLKEAIRTGDIYSHVDVDELAATCETYQEVDPDGPVRKALHEALVVISDIENSSLDALPDERLHLAHAVLMLVANAPDDPHHGLRGSAEVIRGLAKCATPRHAIRHLIKSATHATSLAKDFRERMASAKSYLQDYFYSPSLKPNRFSMESPWQNAMDSFFH